MRVLKQAPARSSSRAWRGLSASSRNCQREVKPWGRSARSRGRSGGAAPEQGASSEEGSAATWCWASLDLRAHSYLSTSAVAGS